MADSCAQNKFQDKRQAIIQITCLFWISTKLFSYKLWHSDRLFPLVPPFGFLENIPNFIHLGLFWMAVSGLIIIIFKPAGYFIAATLLVELCSCLLDQNRWQPYEYQYYISLFFLFCYRKNPKQFLNYFSFLIIATYFFSGLHKFSGSFLYSVWDNLILRRFFRLDHKTASTIFIHYSGLLLPMIEFGSAVGLLIFRKKKVFAGLLITMHLFILVLLSPIGVSYNAVVWPWNVSMILFLYLLYFKDGPANTDVPSLLKKHGKMHLLYLVLLPSVSFFGYYDNYLSFNLYSGGLKSMEICIADKLKAKEYSLFFSKPKFCKAEKSINLNRWALEEMNVLPYPEERNFKEIARKFKLRNPGIDASFIIYQYPYKLQNLKIYK
ncbi:MAG TPA: hypothetical protein VFR70_06890 [Flavobacterium sp.]|nr:hypothetical protein [Flavobacterium sp.]